MTHSPEISEQVLAQVRSRAARATTPDSVTEIIFDVLEQTATDPARTARLQDVKLLLVEAYRSAGLSSTSLLKRPVVA